MKVVLAPGCGFCFGVKRAVDIARSARTLYDEVYVYGELIHNRQILSQLVHEGIFSCQENDLPRLVERTRGGEKLCLLIRAHGVSPEKRKYLHSLPIPLKDATCPDVGRIAGKIRQYGNKGYVVLIYGDRTHPESQGLLGYAPKGFIVENSGDVAQLPSLKNEPICILSQSTMSVENFHEVCQATRRKYPQLLILDTICPATKLRQNSIKYLLERGAESIVVVGDKHSSNTQQLHRLASQFRPTFWVQNVETLTSVFVPNNQNIVGVTAGASTPQDVVNEVCRALSQH